MQLDYTNLNKLNLTPEKDTLTLDTIDQSLQGKDQGWLDTDEIIKSLEPVTELAKDLKNKHKYIVILGIGGSMLGPKCILKTLRKDSNVHFVENVDPQLIADTESAIELDQTLFLVQTKSGGTPESIALFSYFLEKIKESELAIKDHFVFVTDPEQGFLRQFSRDNDIKTLDIPSNIGGRFSVITPIGTLASELAGLDTVSLLEGYQSSIENKKQAYELASHIHNLSEQGYTDLIIFPYSTYLKTFAEWCVQLISESLGKELDNDGNKTNTGITPIPAIGATDQHSQAQLFAEGRYDKQLLFIEIEDFGSNLTIPISSLGNSFDYLEGVTFDKLLNTEKFATAEALTERKRPNYTLKINRLDERELGSMFGLMMLTTAYLGEMMNINAFDQPGVERSKVITRESLSQA